MNFDFLEDIQELGYVYENCNNAEKLAVTMPVQSVFTARKSAELLARFIYLTAHNKQMAGMDFVDILNDPAVRDFIHNQKVMDFKYDAELTIYGENGYTTTDLPEFVYGVLHDLPEADGFKITSTYSGPSVAPWFSVNRKDRKKRSARKFPR